MTLTFRLYPGCAHFFLALLLCLALGWAPAVRASGTVTNCTEADLRAALRGGGQVALACNGTITLSTTLVVAKDVVIDATGFSPTITSAGGTNAPIFVVQPGMHLTLRKLTVSNGQITAAAGSNGQSGLPARGAGMQIDHGFVTLDSCTFSGNTVTAGNGSAALATTSGGDGGQAAGGAIFNNGGQLLITNCTFSANTSVGGAGGNGAASFFGGNGSQGTRGGNGGLGTGAALYNVGNGIITVFNSNFTSNNVTGNTAGQGGTPGGLLGFPGDSGTSGAGLGAAIYNESGSIAIVNSSFVANSAAGSVGQAGIAGNQTQEPTSGNTGGAAEGAGIFNASGQLSLTNCTFVSNTTVGGAGGAGGTGRSNLFGSDGGNGGGGGSALGSGVFTAAQGVTEVVNCTFSDNQVTGGAGGAGGAGTGVANNGRSGGTGLQTGAALYNSGGSVLVKNTILADSLGGANAGGTVSDEGYNLSSDTSPGFNALGSRNTVDPLLGSFVSAGSAAYTMTLSSNSPAINAIADGAGNGAPTFDQRNAQRVYPFDIGAYEAQGVILGPTLQAAQAGTNALAISWPASTSGFQLQSSTNAANTNAWSNLSATPLVTNGLQTVTVPTTNRASYYRLQSTQ